MCAHSDSLQLGPFELGERIEKGGMGVVYRARHARTGETVAIKVLLAESARQEKRHREFRREIQALARLHHPSIAAILDYGDIDAEVAEAGPAPMVEAAPWFAMEYIDGAPMREAAVGWRWREIRSFLLQVLDALAHAHARSIVHRDLKPENILVADHAAGNAPTVKLFDFGIARVFDSDSLDTETSRKRVTGTPKYMAPEQVRGALRNQGPWTDLYALGCVSWRLVCGDAPFGGADTEEILEQQVEQLAPEFDPRFPVPEGLEAWLRALLHKDIDRRTRRAADAAWALLQLGEPKDASASMESLDEIQTVEPVHVQPTLNGMDDTLREVAPETQRGPAVVDDTGEGSMAESELDGGLADAAPDTGPPPMLPDWRRDNEERTVAVVPDAGLQLFSLRETPLVDREMERDRLWNALHDVRDQARPRLVVLEGEAGAGKSRLAQWLCRRTHETGAADVLKATHTPSAGPDEGLRTMLRRRFRTTGLSRGEVFERLLARLPSSGSNDEMRLVDARASTELLRATDDGSEPVDGPRYQFSSPGQKYALVRRLFERLSHRRPLVVWVDDLQWGGETLGALEELFTTAADAPPVFVVATVRADLRTDDTAFAQQLDRLEREAEADRVELRPLGPDDHRALIDRLLDLAPDLADRLAERTEGNPMFAIQLLRDWVERGVLAPGPDGFRLRDDAEVGVPEDVHRLWLDRLRRVIGDVASGNQSTLWRALERAAALGRKLRRDQWRAISRDVIGTDGNDLRDTLVKCGLAAPTSDGWMFAHGFLVQTLEHHARLEHRWRDHHRACADLLEQLSDQAGHTAARRAHHWLEAGEQRRALDPLWQEAERARDVGNSRRAETTLAHRERLLEALDIPATDPLRIENDLQRARSGLSLDTAPDDALEAVEEAGSRAEAIDDDRLLSEAWAAAAACHRRMSEMAAAGEAADRAIQAARRTDDDAALAVALSESGWTEYFRGRLDEADQRLAEAARHSSPDHGESRAVDARRGRAWVAFTRGDEQRAEELFDNLLADCRDHGYRLIESNCLNGLGELARYDGDAGRARSYYRAARRRMRELDQQTEAALATINLALVELSDGEFAKADDLLREGEDRLEALHRRSGYVHLLRLAHLALAAGFGDWGTYDEHLEPYTDGWPADERLVKDHAWLLEMAGDYAADAGRKQRAHRAWRLTRDLWGQLGNEEAVARLDDKT